MKTETAEKNVDKKKKTVSEEEESKQAEACASEPVPEESAEEKLKAELEQANANAEDFKRKWYSVSAEYENYRKRTASVASQKYAEGRADVVKGLFPIADNLGRALQSCKDEGTKRGVELVIAAFEKLLEAEHISEICPLGEPFDAEKCEAVMAVDPAEGEESGIVREVYLKGYEQNGKVLRFAQVVVVK